MYGVPVEIPRLSQLADATRARYIARCDEVPRIRALVSNIFAGDDWCPYRQLTGWYIASFLAHLFQFQDELVACHFNIV